MKNKLYLILILIIIPIILKFLSADSMNIRILGDLKDSNLLLDTVIDKNNYSEFKYYKGRDTAFIFSLDNQKYIKKLMIYFIKNYTPQDIIIEFSSDLFTWEKAKLTKKSRNINPEIELAEYNPQNKSGRFIKFTFKHIKDKDIRISEIKLEINNTLKLNRAEIQVLNVYENSIKFKLITDIESMCFAKYGFSPDTLHDGPVLINYSKENIVNLTGLLKGTEYYIIGIAKDCNENLKYSSPVRVKTAGIPLPLFKKISAENIKHDSFSLDFRSNIETKYNIYYGYSAVNMNKISYSDLKTDHNVIFKDLQQETMFFYQIEIIDKSGNKCISEILNMKTLPESIGAKSSISGDFQYIGESLNPVFQKDSINRLTDGDFSYINGSVMSGNINAQEQNLVFDLKDITFIQRIDYIWWALMYSTDFNVEISEDSRNWTPLKKQAGTDAEIKYDFISAIPYMVSRVEINKKVRYVRSTFKKDKYVSRFPQYFNLRLLEVLIIPENIPNRAIKPVLIK